MKKIILILVSTFIFNSIAKAQVAGDTIVVNSFNYSQTYGTGIRDTMIDFPNLPSVNFEKIIMLYNMRCKNGAVGNQVPPSGTSGCGEWDYSCNTYITDSTKIDSTKATHPSHIIPGFSGSTFPYTSIPTYTYYQYAQQNVVTTSTINETVSTLGSGINTSNYPFNGAVKNSKSQFLWTAAELTSAGLTAGNISSLKLNISTLGSSAQFLKIRIKHSTQTALNSSTPDLTGFTEVYFLNTSFVNGINNLQFYNNFNWNGTDNILVEFSFSNPTNGTNNICLSDNTPTILGLVTDENDYMIDFNGSSQLVLSNNNFASFSNEISISFWANGNPNILPINTSAFYSTNALNHRQVNIHLPWSNSRIYWDCGSGGPSDRIDQLATNNEFKGQWNHYTFTKNASTGIMNIYINGTLFMTGTGKTIPIELMTFMIGAGPNMVNPYFGKIDDFSLWDIELSAATIQNWMNKKINATHPNFSNLIANYKLNEGVGNVCFDAASIASLSSNLSGLSTWNYYKGKDIFKNFEETTNRPQVSFVKGTYTQTITPIIVLDSIPNTQKTVYEFAIVNGIVTPIDTTNFYSSGYSYVYDGDNNSLLDSVLVSPQGTINIIDLNYFLKSPSRFQIMSFVTPYGNGLNLGIDGKTWTFDVTDFAPILKGKKRMTMDAGGQWQEDMDIKFLFIVGTPPKNIIDINNIWKVEAIGYTNILNDSKFEPRQVKMKANASSFKLRTAITGHGQEGEFIPRTHQINIGGGSPEYTWDVWKKCGENPVYPQGGTWIYDRAGWCPGMATDLVETDITSFVTPGQNAEIDYSITTASGHSDYWVSSQLVEYGNANFALDAAIEDIKNPTTKVEYARINPICNAPTIVIKNTGTTALTSLKIEYWINNSTQKEVFNWTGNLAFLEKTEVILPSNDVFWSAVTSATNNNFHVEISNPNNGTDGYIHNNKMKSNFNITNVVPADFVLWVRTNNFGAETKYKIIDQFNNVVLDRNSLSNNTDYKDTLKFAPGCYKLILEDAGEDGLSFWANSAAGTGWARFRRTTGSSLFTLQPDFGTSSVFSFTIEYPLSFEDLYEKNLVKLYPNPAQNMVTLEAENIFENSISIFNSIGQKIILPEVKEKNKLKFDTKNLHPGLYHVLINNKNGNKQTIKLIKE